MPDISDIIATEYVEDDIDFIRVEAMLDRAVAKKLREMQAQGVEAVRRIDPTEPQRLGDRQTRAEKVDKAILPIAVAGYAAINKMTQAELVALSASVAKATIQSTNQAIGAPIIRKQTLSRGLRLRVVQNTTVQGLTIPGWWDKQAENFHAAFVGKTNTSVQAEETLTQLVSRIKGSTITGRSGSVVVTSQRQAEALVRTGLNSVVNQTRAKVYEANADVIDGIQASNPLDARTSDICRARAGMAWTLDGAPFPGMPQAGQFPGYPPWHWGCRTIMIPIIKRVEALKRVKGPRGRRLRKQLGELEKSKVAALNGKPATGMTFNDMLKTKSPERQKKILGPGRYKLWKEGKISMQDLIDQRNRPLTLKQLDKRIDDKAST